MALVAATEYGRAENKVCDGGADRSDGRGEKTRRIRILSFVRSTAAVGCKVSLASSTPWLTR
jgi:hypothetical protein